MRILGAVLLGIGALLLGPLHAGMYRLEAAAAKGRRRVGREPFRRLKGASHFVLGVTGGSGAGVAIALLAGVPVNGQPVEAALVLASGGVGTLIGALLGALAWSGAEREQGER